jgi:hypothetical protein
MPPSINNPCAISCRNIAHAPRCQELEACVNNSKPKAFQHLCIRGSAWITEKLEPTHLSPVMALDDPTVPQAMDHDALHTDALAGGRASLELPLTNPV